MWINIPNIIKYSKLMKSFQKSQPQPTKLLPKNCIHGRSSLRYLSCNTKAPTQISPTLKNNFTNKRQENMVKNCFQNQNSNSNSNQNQDQSTKMMRSLIAMNQNYFQDKLYIENHGKPSKLKLKIPSFTGFTTYKKDYVRSGCAGLYQGHSGVHQFKERKGKVDFFDGTTYQNQYLGIQNKQDSSSQIFCPSNPKNHPKTDKTKSQAPTFNQSQYKRNFVNWGTGSHMPSMKPQPNPAVTNLPFNPHTVYSTQFTKKKNIKKQNFNTSNICSFNINGNANGNYGKGEHLQNVDSHSKLVVLGMLLLCSILLLMICTLIGRIIIQSLGIDGGLFKGKTQYQSEFIKQHGVQDKGHPKKTLGQLQNLILNL